MKEIRYPSEDWLLKWEDDFIDHYSKPISDGAWLREQAMQAWWDEQIEKGNPTPFDLSEEQAKVAKEMGPKARAVNAYGKAVKRERKPDEEKRELIARLAEALADLSPEVVNPEREIRFGSYSITLTRHRTPKG